MGGGGRGPQSNLSTPYYGIMLTNSYDLNKPEKVGVLTNVKVKFNKAWENYIIYILLDNFERKVQLNTVL